MNQTSNFASVNFEFRIKTQHDIFRVFWFNIFDSNKFNTYSKISPKQQPAAKKLGVKNESGGSCYMYVRYKTLKLGLHIKKR